MSNIVENFLLNGGPEPPESRATKPDLERHIEQRDKLLRSLRGALLKSVSAEMERANKKEKGAIPIDSLTHAQLTALYGSPIPERIVSKMFDNRGQVESFVNNEIGAHRVLSITSYSHGATDGQQYTVFYKE